MVCVHNPVNTRLNYLICTIVSLSLFCGGCATGQGGEVAAGILQGIGAGLSGL